MPTLERPPADEDVGRTLDQALPGDDALTVMDELARSGRRLIDRRTSLLDLEEQGVSPASTLEQDQVHAHPHAAHTDHLPHHVGHGEAIEQATTICLERRSVLGEQLVDEGRLLGVIDRHPDRRILGDAGPASRCRGELLEGTSAGAVALLLLDVHRDSASVGGFEEAQQAVDVHPVVPDVELGHGGVAGHPKSIRVSCSPRRCQRDLLPDAVDPRRDDEARRQPLEIPLEGAGEGLVEVTEIEHQVPLWRRPQAEVEDVRITTELDIETAIGLRGEVSGHDAGGTSVEVPRRDRHP